MSPLEAIGHLVGIQAQAPQARYVGLWTRVRGLTAAGLSDLLTSRQAVRIAVMRGTIHLVTADDCVYLRPLVQSVHVRSFHGNWGRRIPDVDLDLVAAQARAILEARPMTFQELGAALVAQWPGREAAALAQAGRTMLAVSGLGRPLSEKDKAAVIDEGRRMLAFAAPEGADVEISIDGLGEVQVRVRT
jgi:hypothetical protein